MKKHFFLLIFSMTITSFLCFGANVKHDDGHKKERGVGPIKTGTLGPIDAKMVAQGKTIFTNTCALCHELDQVKIGPPLRNITKDRQPQYIMNLLLNTSGMQQQDPYVKALIEK